MRKNFMVVAFVAAIALIAGINVYHVQKTVTLSDIAMENVEALAQDETIIACWDDVFHKVLFYCKPNMMLACYCDGLKPGRGWERTETPGL